MVLELKREKALLAKQQNNASAKRRAKVTAVSTAGYASKLGGGMSAATGAAGGWVELDPNQVAGLTEEEELEEAKKASLAQAHKERLLEYDRTSARRSHVIDQATDFVLPGDRPNLWLTEEERQAEAIKAQQNHEKATTAASGYQRAKVMTIDVKNRRVVVEATSSFAEEEEVDDSVPEPVSKVDQAKSTSISGGNRHGGRGGAFAQNPLLRLGETPTFVPKGQPKKGSGREAHKNVKEKILKAKAEKPKVSRLQYDDGSHAAVMEDAQYSFSTGGDLQTVLAGIVEPSCG